MQLRTLVIECEFNDLPKTVDAEVIMIQPSLMVLSVRDSIFSLSYIPSTELGRGELVLTTRKPLDVHGHHTWIIRNKVDLQQHLQVAAAVIGMGARKSTHTRIN